MIMFVISCKITVFLSNIQNFHKKNGRQIQDCPPLNIVPISFLSKNETFYRLIEFEIATCIVVRDILNHTA